MRLTNAMGIIAFVMAEERRFSSRLKVAYPARLRGWDAAGRTWIENVRIDNISSGGLCVRLSRALQTETQLLIAVRLSIAPSVKPALRLVARGVVLRTTAQPDGTCQVAVEFTRRRVL